tara:strand:- start:792 stop:1271 length:480 start_codon:yes stop_codon:yes gene_type:complete
MNLSRRMFLTRSGAIAATSAVATIARPRQAVAAEEVVPAPANAQEAFHRIWDHYVVQGKNLSKWKNKPMFCTPNGDRCPIGIFLTEKQAKKCDDYGKKHGRFSFDENLTKPPQELSFLKSLSKVSVDFWGTIECVHDRSSNYEELKKNLQAIEEFVLKL